MTESVNEILAERFAVKVFAMSIDVVVRDVEEAVLFVAAENGAGLDGGDGGVLGGKNDVVDFALARSEFSVGGNGASDVGGVAGILRADVEHDDVAVLNFAIEAIVMKRGGIGASADDGRVAFGFRATHGVDFNHFCADLIFEETRVHHFHGGDVRVEREVDGFLKKSDFAGRFDLALGFDLRADVF